MYILNSLTLCMFIKHMCVNFEGDKKIRYNFLLINIYQGYTEWPREAAKKIVAQSLRGGGDTWPLRKNNLFEAQNFLKKCGN